MMRPRRSNRGFSLIEAMIMMSVALIVSLGIAEMIRQQHKQIKTLESQQDAIEAKTILMRTLSGVTGGGNCCPIGNLTVGDITFSSTTTPVSVDKVYLNCLGNQIVAQSNGRFTSLPSLTTRAITLTDFIGSNDVYAVKLNVEVNSSTGMALRPVQVNMSIITSGTTTKSIVACNISSENKMPIDYNDCQDQIRWYGANNICPAGMANIGLCGSGSDPNCSTSSGSGYSVSRCCRIKNFTQNRCTWKAGGFGRYLTCDPGSIVAGVCGSGRNADCSNPRSHHKIMCCPTIATNPNVTHYQCHWIFGGDGSTIHCPNGEILRGACGSGRNADCGGHYTAAYCCPAL